ncbi:hypothetical protein KI387_003511, partial [Taxus chinensis]
MQAKSQGPSVVEHYPSRRVEYDENSVPVDIPRIDCEIKEEMDSVGNPTAADKTAPVNTIINDKVDFDTISKLSPMSMPEVGTSTCGKASADDKPATPFNPKHGQGALCFVETTKKCSPRNSHPLSTGEMKDPNGSAPTVSGSGISACFGEDDENGLRDIRVDEGIPLEEKVVISLDHNIHFEKLSGVLLSSTIEGSCCSSHLGDKECKPEDQCSSGHDWDRLAQGELPCSQLNKRTEEENDMLDEVCVLKSVNIDDENFPISSKENKEVKQNGIVHSFDEGRSSNTTFENKENNLGCLTKESDSCDEKRSNPSDYSDGKSELSRLRLSTVPGSFVEKVRIVPDGTSTSKKYRENEIAFSVCGDGSHDKGITSNGNYAGESFEARGKEMKDCDYLSQENAEHYLAKKFRTTTNPFAESEEEVQFMLELYSASLGSHSASSTGEKVEPEGKQSKDGGYLSHENAELYLSNNFHLRTNPFALLLSQEEAQFMPELYSASLGSHSASSTGEIVEAEVKMLKDTGYLSQKNAEFCLPNKFQLRTNPFAISEEEAQFMPESYSAPLENHSVSSASLLTGHAVSEHLTENASLKSKGMALNALDNLHIDPVLGQQVLSEQVIASEADPNKSVEEPYSEKCGDSTHSASLENSARIDTSTVAAVDSDAGKDMENQKQKTVGSSTFTGSLVGQVPSLEMGWNVPRQSINQVTYDISDKVNGNNNASEMSAYTYSGPISLSGPISYSGPIPLSGRVSFSSGGVPYSGSLSIRSDSSTGSTQSFAFPT